MAYPTLTAKQAQKIRDIWLDSWHHSTGNLDTTQLWFESVLTYLGREGYELMPAEVRTNEERIMSQGLSKEYLAALRQVIDCGFSRSEEETAVLILTATPEERTEAIKKVVG